MDGLMERTRSDGVELHAHEHNTQVIGGCIKAGITHKVCSPARTCVWGRERVSNG